MEVFTKCGPTCCDRVWHVQNVTVRIDSAGDVQDSKIWAQSPFFYLGTERTSAKKLVPFGPCGWDRVNTRPHAGTWYDSGTCHLHR